MIRVAITWAMCWWAMSLEASETDAPRLAILFLGDHGHHRPAERFAQLQPVLAARGIDLTYSDRVTDLNPRTLSSYAGLIIYANVTEITPDQERALLDYVAAGKGFIPLHCASYCFLNSPKYIELVGAQFQKHGTGVFRTQSGERDHPLMKGFGGFESWDETYVHHRHNERDRTVLEYRVDQEGREPWTWVRTQGRGRVFYTAWGHDERTWSNPGFHNLVERGIRWAVGADLAVVPEFTDPNAFDALAMTPLRTDVQPFEYVDAEIPFYPPSPQWGVMGEPLSKMQRPLEPAESLKHFVTPVGFRVELFAAEPDLGGKPICMTWDERGRLWVAETVDYPNELQPEGSGRDRIRICEDTDEDGRADKFMVFAEHLSIPTSMTRAYGGVVVHQAPHTLFLKDTDGDDRADIREVLFTGWNTQDTHAGPSNLQYGSDNWLWGMQGYAGFEGQVGGETHRFAMGFYRFKLDRPETATGIPRVTRLEFVRSTNNNTWGLGFSEDGLVFGSTANRNPSVYMPIANRYYERVRGWSAEQLGTIADTFMFKPITEKIRQVDQHGGYTAAAGHSLYTARAYPKTYWNRTAFVCGPTGHLVGTFLLKRQGADFASTSPANLLASDDEWSAPIMAEVGPDGNVWVIDWYNYIVQHNPTPAGYKTGKGNAYETDLRDKKHGRIYRIVCEAAVGRPTVRTLANAGPPTLVETLRDSNLFWRRHAQRLLVERGDRDVLPALVELAGDPGMDEIGLNPGSMHALWTLHGLGALDGSDVTATAAAVRALDHGSAAVRRAAVGVLPPTSASASALMEHGCLRDSDAQVRLATCLALADMPPSKEVAAAIVAALQRPENAGDHWIPAAATSAAATNAPYFLAALAAAESTSESLLVTAGIVAEHFARGSVTAGELANIAEPLAEAQPPVADAIVAGLAKGWPQAHALKLEPATEQRLATLMPRLSTGQQGQLLRLAVSWGSKEFEQFGAQISQRLSATAGDEDLADDERIAAVRQLVEFRATDDSLIPQVLALITPRTGPELAVGFLGALEACKSDALGPLLVDHIAGLTPAAKNAAMRLLLARPALTATLLDSLDKGQIAFSDLSLDQKQSLTAHPNAGLARRAKELMARGGGLPNADRQAVLSQLLPLTEQKGSVEQGKEVFKKQCSKCHVHSGEGTRIGPDLTGMAVHTKAELLTNVIDPSRSVEGNFRVYTVVTEQGRVINGLMASETKTSIELYDSEGKKNIVLREDIDQLLASSKSLMPEGFEKQVTAADIINLLEFLTARGKYLPIPLHKVATSVSTVGMFISETADVERLIFPDWSPKVFHGVPFNLIDPQGDRVPNVILFYGPQGTFAPKMPKTVSLPCNAPAKTIHFLSGVSGWGYPFSEKGSVSLIVRLHYADGQTEDHPLKNGLHFADYIRAVDVPESELAFRLRGQQIRYLSINPQQSSVIAQIELIKGPDDTAPVVMAITVEAP